MRITNLHLPLQAVAAAAARPVAPDEAAAAAAGVSPQPHAAAAAEAVPRPHAAPAAGPRRPADAAAVERVLRKEFLDYNSHDANDLSERRTCLLSCSSAPHLSA